MIANGVADCGSRGRFDGGGLWPDSGEASRVSGTAFRTALTGAKGGLGRMVDYVATDWAVSLLRSGRDAASLGEENVLRFRVAADEPGIRMNRPELIDQPSGASRLPKHASIFARVNKGAGLAETAQPTVPFELQDRERKTLQKLEKQAAGGEVEYKEVPYETRGDKPLHRREQPGVSVENPAGVREHLEGRN